jgi:hypothetical protein
MLSGSNAFNSFDDFNILVDSCESFYKKNQEIFNSEVRRERCKQLSFYIRKFHRNSATLTPEIASKIDILGEEPSIILMTAHQPNLFPYSGVLRKATLLIVLEKELERRLGVNVISYYGIADQDFADDRWVRSSIVPSLTRKDGILALSAKLPLKVTTNNLPKPPMDTMEKWREKIEMWLNDATYSIGHFYTSNGLPKLSLIVSRLHNNFEMLWRIIEEAYERAITYSDFNAFVMSKIVNEAWQYDTLFSRFSESQSIFSSEFNYLLTHFAEYSASMKEAIEKMPKGENAKGVSLTEPEYLPFWYHCDCGGKARLTPYFDRDHMIGHGSCIRCSKEYEVNLGVKERPDVSEISLKISATAIPMILIFSKGLGLTSYVGGLGGKEYLREAQHVAEKLDITMPVIAYWRPHDFYLSISNLNALSEYKKISGNYEIHKWKKEVELLKSKITEINDDINELELKRNGIIVNIKKDQTKIRIYEEELRKISKTINTIRKWSNLSVLQYHIRELSNIPSTITSIPSIIDYAINIGLKETSDQWISHLMSNGSLSSDICMNSLFEDLYKKQPSVFDNIYKSFFGLKDPERV